MEETNTEQVATKRDMMKERLKKKYPDKEWADDEEMMGQIHDDYDQYDKALGEKDGTIAQYQQREKELTDLFNKDPRAAQFMVDWADGKDPFSSSIRRIGIDNFREMLDSPEALEKYAEDNKAYLERMAKAKELEDEAEKNLAETAEMLEGLIEEGVYSQEQIDGALSLLRSIFEDALKGKYSRENIEMAVKALNYDDDVESASMEGEVRGKNTKIVEKLRKASKGDGTPTLGGKNGTVATAKDDRRSLGALGNYDNTSNSIWERGGVKRKRY